VLGELQPVRDIGDSLQYSEGASVPGCEFSYLRSTGEWKVGCGEVHPVARLEYKGAAASVCILFLAILCNSE
jgi:hypothetical protein